jgi:hypothetical protein
VTFLFVTSYHFLLQVKKFEQQPGPHQSVHQSSTHNTKLSELHNEPIQVRFSQHSGSGRKTLLGFVPSVGRKKVAVRRRASAQDLTSRLVASPVCQHWSFAEMITFTFFQRTKTRDAMTLLEPTGEKQITSAIRPFEAHVNVFKELRVGSICQLTALLNVVSNRRVSKLGNDLYWKNSAAVLSAKLGIMQHHQRKKLDIMSNNF